MSWFDPELRMQIALCNYKNRQRRKRFEAEMTERFGDRFQDLSFTEHLDLTLKFLSMETKTITSRRKEYARSTRFGDDINPIQYTFGNHPEYGDHHICLIDFNGGGYVILPKECH